jgi:hypothetical protein
LLANRIALLKQEEMRTWKKIEETKKRSQEVMRLKQRQNEKITKKIEHMQYQEIVKADLVDLHKKNRTDSLFEKK